MTDIPNLPSPPPGPSPAPEEGPAPPQELDGPPTVQRVVDALLKNPERIVTEASGPRQRQVARVLLGVTVLCLAAYGLLAGLFSGGTQLWAAPLKITVGALAAGMLCYPSLYIFTCMAGADCGPGQMLGVLLGMLALTAILLIGFAPVIWIFSMSTETLWFMGLLHLAFWFIATYFGLAFILRAFRRSPAAPPGQLVVWCLIFVLVTLQMTCALRPILGTADTVLPDEKQFFLTHWGAHLDQPASR